MKSNFMSLLLMIMAMVVCVGATSGGLNEFIQSIAGVPPNIAVITAMTEKSGLEHANVLSNNVKSAAFVAGVTSSKEMFKDIGARVTTVRVSARDEVEIVTTETETTEVSFEEIVPDETSFIIAETSKMVIPKKLESTAWLVTTSKKVMSKLTSTSKVGHKTEFETTNTSKFSIKSDSDTELCSKWYYYWIDTTFKKRTEAFSA